MICLILQFFLKDNNDKTVVRSCQQRKISNEVSNDFPAHKSDYPSRKGLRFSLLSSFINHSCIPNVVKIFKDENVVFYVVRPIRMNEQVMILSQPKLFLIFQSFLYYFHFD